MSDQVSWSVELAVKPSKLHSYRELTEEKVACTREKFGLLSYEWFISSDGTVVHVSERYTDSVAAVAHLVTFGNKFAGRFLEMVERKRFTVYGNPSDELRGVLDGFGVTSLHPFGGLPR